MMKIDMNQFALRVAEKQGWAANPDQELLSDILKGLEVNKERYGFFLCPCRDSWGDKKKDQDITCPCSYCGEDILEFNRCFCGLFVKEGSREDEIQDGVPDRRPEELYPD